MSTAVLLNPVTHLRVDKNFAFNISVFKKYSAEDRSLLKDIILYVTLNFQKDLFGFSTIDPDDFCEVMNRKKNKIFEKHEDPIFYRINDLSRDELDDLEATHGRTSKYRIWNTKFENALLILQKETIIHSYALNTIDTDRVSIEDFRYFKKVVFQTQKRGRARKIIYQYMATEEFESSLIRFFTNVNLQTYLLTKKAHLDDCYFELLNRIHSFEYKGKYELYYNIIEFAKTLNISTNALLEEQAYNKELLPKQKPQRGAFSDLKYKINRKFKTFQSLTEDDFHNLKHEWVYAKGDRKSRYKNVIKITWTPKSEEVLREERRKIFEDLFYTELFKDLSMFFNNNHKVFELNDDVVVIKFMEWLFSAEDYDVKKSKYISIFVDTRGNDYDKLDTKAVDFLSMIISAGDWNRKSPFLGYDKGTYFVIDPKSKEKMEFGHIKHVVYMIEKNFNYFKTLVH